MQEAPYKIHRIRRQQMNGLTAPSPCTLSAILKFDCPDSPNCVFNEQVAVRLAQTLHIPVADGVLTTAGDGQCYASLEVSSPGIVLPDILKSQITEVVHTYPDEAAALVAFDILIGNWDRARNIKASLVSPHMPVFRAFDHSHALLTISEDPKESIKRLKSTELIVTYHTFYGLVYKYLLDSWIDRITALDDIYFEECCMFAGRPFRAVSASMQGDLADALVWRKSNLRAIVTENLDRIAPSP